jgi:Tfp pilus assembly protein PilF
LNLGILYFNKRHYAEAEHYLKDASKDLSYANAGQVAMGLANIYTIQNKPVLAEEQLKKAVSENVGNCEAWTRLGLLQKERGDYEAAIQSMKGATTGVCYKNPQAHYELASIFLKTHDVPQAKAKLLELIQLFPHTEWAEKSESTLNMIR